MNLYLKKHQTLRFIYVNTNLSLFVVGFRFSFMTCKFTHPLTTFSRPITIALIFRIFCLLYLVLKVETCEIGKVKIFQMFIRIPYLMFFSLSLISYIQLFVT